MKKYPKMKPSGVEWIGDVPEGWEVKRLKYLCHIITGEKDTVDNEEEGEYPFFVRSQSVERISTYSFDGEAVLTAGDGVGVGKVFHYINGKFDFHQRVYKMSNFKQVLGRYFFYHIRENFHKEVMKISAKSTVDSLRLYMIQNFPVVFGNESEQKEIVTYLDRKTAQIDQAISEKERLIELFREERQAIINHAVTKGIRAWVKMIPSGVEWIGDVPEGWAVSSIKRAIFLLTDYDANGSFSTIKENVNRVDELDNQFAWMVRATDLENQSQINETENLVWVDEKTYNFLAKSYLSVGDLLVVKRGEIGKLYLMPEFSKPATLGPNMYLVRLKSDVLKPNFGYYFLVSESGNAQLRLLNKSTTIGALYKDDFKSILIAYPPIAEQLEIAFYLDQKTAQIDTAILGIQQEITLLQEYRQALIFEAVTGKIDVRECIQTN